MALHHRNFFAHSIITFLSLVSCSSGIRSYSIVDSSPFDDSIKLETGAYDGLSKFSGLESSFRTINVDSFGAKANGADDDSKAFQAAWKEACSSTVAVNLVVSQGKNYLLKPIIFSGPCKSEIIIRIYGTLQASDDRSDYSKDGRHWILFDKVQSLIVEGGGIINGNGKIWWQNSCKTKKTVPCKKAPTAVTFNNCKNMIVQNLKIHNAQQMHMAFDRCVNVQVSNLVVTAPEKSPNTDGIHVANTQHIQISNCTIGTGDDCISIVSGSQEVHATNITCGPGHGISIGSLGSGNSEAHVSNVTINGAKFSGSTNGVRIKTWQGGSGSASNIRFQNIQMQDVENPIIIDQNYCDQTAPCNQQNSAVQIRDVVYQNIKGTSTSNIAVNLNCSKRFPCQGIVLQNVHLVGEGGGAARASCNNVNLKYVGAVSPRCAVKRRGIAGSLFLISQLLSIDAGDSWFSWRKSS